MSVDFDTRQQILRDLATGASSAKYGQDEQEYRRRCEAEFSAFRRKYPRATLAFSSGPEGLPTPGEARADGGPGSGPRKGGGTKSKSVADAPLAKISTEKLSSTYLKYRAEVENATPGSDQAKLAEIKLKDVESELLTRNPESNFLGTTMTKKSSIVKAHEAGVSTVKAGSSVSEPVAASPDKIAPDKRAMTTTAFKTDRAAFTRLLSKDEKKAVKQYTDEDDEGDNENASRAINAHLRSGKEPTPQMLLMDSALAKYAMKKDTLVYRGVSETHGEVFDALRPGDSFVDPGYMSTGQSRPFDGPIVFHITVPKGMKAGPIPSNKAEENEFLLPRGSKLRITDVTVIPNAFEGSHRKTIHATVEQGEARADGGPGSGPKAGYKRGPNKSSGTSFAHPEEAGIGAFSSHDGVTGPKKSSAPSSYAKVSTKKLTSKLAEYREKVKTATPGSKAAKLAEIKLKHIESELESRGVDHSGVQAAKPGPKPPKVSPHAIGPSLGATGDDGFAPQSKPVVPKPVIAPSPAQSTAATPKYTPQEKALHHKSLAAAESATASKAMAAFGDKFEDEETGLNSKNMEIFQKAQGELALGKMNMLEAESLHAAGKFELASAATKQAKAHFSNAQNAVKPVEAPAKIVDLPDKTMSVGLFETQREAFRGKLAPKELASVLDYSGSGYRAINHSARKGDASNSHIKHIDSAIAKSSPLTETLTTYRGAKPKNFSDLQPGDTFVDKGFASTSISLARAQGFSRGILFKITTPPGKTVAPIPSDNSTELEFLVPRNTKYRVTKVEIGKITPHDFEPTKIVHVEVE